MVHFEDLEIGQTITFGQYRVTQEELIDFARRFQPHSSSQSVEASPWFAGAMSARLLEELEASEPAAGLKFVANAQDISWGSETIQRGDVLYVEVEILDFAEPTNLDGMRGWATVEVRLIATGTRDGGTWGDYYNSNDLEHLEMIKYRATIMVLRREKVPMPWPS